MRTLTSRTSGAVTPRELPGRFEEAFNEGDFPGIDVLFDSAAIRVMPGGVILAGERRADPTRALYESGARLRLSVQGCFEADGVALVLTRSEILRPDGTSSTGTAIDVARRDDASGRWLYLVDNPQAIGLTA